MRGRAGPEAVSARALARLRSGGADGWVPSRESLGLDEEGAGHDGARGPAGRRRRVPSDREGEGAPVGGGPPVGEARGAGGRGDARDAAGRHRPGMPGGGWLRLPAAFVGARWQPGRAAVAGVALVTVLAVLVLGLRVAWARESGGEPVVSSGDDTTIGVPVGSAPVALPSATAPDPSALPGGDVPSAPSSSPAAPVPAAVVVHVVGEVRRPGVRRLTAGARVADAVEAAGGATGRADLGGLNLARVLVDGEQVRVPRPGEVVAAPAPGPGTSTADAGGTPDGGGQAGAPVSVNTADVAALDTLPGIGPVLAQRIVDWRTENGSFSSVDELAEVSGIGEKVLADLRPLVTL